MKTVCIDFDGTIARYDGWKGVGVFGDPLPGARDALVTMKLLGWTVIIFTTRGEVGKIKEYLCEHNIPFDYINENPDNHSHMNPGKPIADVYIDDRALTFTGAWNDKFLLSVDKFQSWYKRPDKPETVSDILERAKETFECRNKEYGSAYKTKGAVMKALFPEGLTLSSEEDFTRFDLLNMVISKLHRYVHKFPDKKPHRDSVHDLAVYAVMLQEIDSILTKESLL